MPQVVFFLPSTWEAWIEIHVVGIWGINQRMASYNLSSPPFNIIMWTLLSKKKKKKVISSLDSKPAKAGTR